MNAAPLEALESRRQVLVAAISFQRFELRAHVGALRARGLTGRWPRYAAAAALVCGIWLLRRNV